MGLRRFFQRRTEDAELAQELQAHIAHQVDENISAGMPAEEARRQAYLKLGNPQQVREKVWQWNTVKFFEHLVQDLALCAPHAAADTGICCSRHANARPR